MSSRVSLGSHLAGPPDRGTLSRARRLACQGENLLLVAALAAMLLLPVAEILLRHVLKTGVSGSSAIVQHLTLIVGMLGGAIAARDGRLLALSPIQTLLTGRARVAAKVFSSGFAAAICFFLCLASMQYVLEMKPLGKILVYGIPVWVIQLFLPLGFECHPRHFHVQHDCHARRQQKHHQQRKTRFLSPPFHPAISGSNGKFCCRLDCVSSITTRFCPMRTTR